MTNVVRQGNHERFTSQPVSTYSKIPNRMFTRKGKEKGPQANADLPVDDLRDSGKL
jgi:hypothetical protein